MTAKLASLHSPSRTCAGLLRLSRAAAILCSFLLFGCTEPISDPPSPDSNSLAADYALDLTLSGGFAGIEHKFSLVSELGVITAADIDRNTSATYTLGETERQEFSALVQAAAQSDATTSLNDQCADCMQIDLSIDYAGQLRSVTLDSTTLKDPDLIALVERLSTAGRRVLEASELETRSTQ